MKPTPGATGATRSGATRTAAHPEDEKDDAASPSLPHERDQDATTRTAEPRGKIKQAFKDVQSGQQDTDRRHATDKITDPQINADAPGSR